MKKIFFVIFFAIILEKFLTLYYNKTDHQTPKEGYTMTEVLYQPQTVYVAGLQEDLEGIENIVINDISISGMDTDLETTVDLKEYLPKNIYLADGDGEVVITVSLEELTTKVITITPEDINLLQKTADKDYSLELSDDFVIKVTGLDSQVSDITIEKLVPRIYCKDKPTGNHSNVDIEINDIEGVECSIEGTVTLIISAQ